MTKKRAIVFSGGRLNEEDLHQIQPDDFIIGADKGALFPDRARCYTTYLCRRF